MNELEKDSVGLTKNISYMKTILIVDDEEDDLESMNQILKKEGYNVVTSSNGPEVLKKLGENNVDLILMDILMPTLSGYDVLRILREKLAHNIPVVFVSIKPEKEVDMTNVDGFVQKPFNPSVLVNEINRAITKTNKSIW